VAASGLIGQADAVDEAHVHVDDLEALLVATAAGDHLGFVVHVAGVPQAVGDQRRRAFGGGQLGVAVSPTLVASSCTTPFSTLITRPSGHGNPACRPGPKTSTGLPKRS
jgi:hypothetical protein